MPANGFPDLLDRAAILAALSPAARAQVQQLQVDDETESTQALALAAGPNAQDPDVLARETLGAHLSNASATAISRAESRAEAVAILLMTPEFQRR